MNRNFIRIKNQRFCIEDVERYAVCNDKDDYWINLLLYGADLAENRLVTIECDNFLEQAKIMDILDSIFNVTTLYLDGELEITNIRDVMEEVIIVDDNKS